MGRGKSHLLLTIHCRGYPKVNSALVTSLCLSFLLHLLVMIHLMRRGCHLKFLLSHEWGVVTVKQRGPTKPFRCRYDITRKLDRSLAFTQPARRLLG